MGSGGISLTTYPCILLDPEIPSAQDLPSHELGVFDSPVCLFGEPAFERIGVKRKLSSNRFPTN